MHAHGMYQLFYPEKNADHHSTQRTKKYIMHLHMHTYSEVLCFASVKAKKPKLQSSMNWS